MAFMTIRIDVRLNEADDEELRDASKAIHRSSFGDQPAARAKELEIMDRHSDRITEVARDRIEAICQELAALGYLVEADM